MPIVSNDPTVLQIVARAGELKREKQPWLRFWQLLGEFIHTRKQNFTDTLEAGEFLNQELFDSTAPQAAKVAASAILSMLWPQAVKRFRLNPPESLQPRPEIKKLYEFQTRTLTRIFDNPKTGMQTSLDEYMLDQMCFATSGIETDRHPETGLVFRPWGVKHMSIDEGANGLVDTVYLHLSWSVSKVVKTYGLKHVSANVRGLFNKNETSKEVKLLIAIEPRVTFAKGAKGNKAMPWRSVHIEIDTNKKLKESGFTEMPLKVGRFTKLISEKYGRGFGMDALPDALELNAIWESVTIAIEKILDPPLGVLDDGVLGTNDLDTSAGAINVFNVSGRAGDSNPVFPLFTVGEIKQTVGLIERREQSIQDKFAIDRLLNFNNETKMTLGEAQIRLRLQNATLRSIFSRQIAEVISPTIERSYNLLLEDGKLGTLPGQPARPGMPAIPEDVFELMISGESVYEIEYFTPAMRVMQAEEGEGLIRTWEFAAQVAQLNPAVTDNLDPDESVSRFRAITGAPSEIQRSQADVDQIRGERAQAEAKQAEQDQLAAGAEAARNIGQSNLLDQLPLALA